MFGFGPTRAEGAGKPPILIGLDADLSAASAQAGQSIRRGLLVAIDQINTRGGVLGRELALVERNHRGNPARARVHIAELAALDNLVAVFGGLHTPAALEVLPVVHDREVLFLIPWAAGTEIVENGYTPNYVFRVSVRDAEAGGYLVQEAVASGYRRLGLLLENTAWGRSNRLAMIRAAEARGLPEVAVQWFNWGVGNLDPQLAHFLEQGVEAVLLVANAPEGVTVIRAIRALSEERRFPVLSHWGIAGGDFAVMAGDALPEVDLRFLQTFSFLRPPVPRRAEELWAAHRRMFPEFVDRLDVPAAPGLAHAYDLAHLLALAIESAGTTDRPAVRAAMEALGDHDGVMKMYRRPFTRDRHDALDAGSFHLARFNRDGQIVPATGRRASQ